MARAGKGPRAFATAGAAGAGQRSQRVEYGPVELGDEESWDQGHHWSGQPRFPRGLETGEWTLAVTLLMNEAQKPKARGRKPSTVSHDFKSSCSKLHGYSTQLHTSPLSSGVRPGLLCLMPLLLAWLADCLRSALA